MHISCRRTRTRCWRTQARSWPVRSARPDPPRPWGQGRRHFCTLSLMLGRCRSAPALFCTACAHPWLCATMHRHRRDCSLGRTNGSHSPLSRSGDDCDTNRGDFPCERRGVGRRGRRGVARCASRGGDPNASRAGDRSGNPGASPGDDRCASRDAGHCASRDVDRNANCGSARREPVRRRIGRPPTGAHRPLRLI